MAKPGSIEHCLSNASIRARFEQMLGARAPQFMSSIITVAKGFSQPVDPSTVVAAAAIAATLDLPIEKGLGFAHIVPYGGMAQFQLGYKAYIQLALRSGQYRNMNAARINAEAYGGRDDIGEPIINWSQLDESKEAVGYAFSWRLTTGFQKTVYWTKKEVIAHAERFSQAYKKKKTDSPWFTAFDAMALKVVISSGLRKWGILSVQMQTALTHDETVMKDIDAEPVYIEHQNILPPKAPVAGVATTDTDNEAAEAAIGLAPEPSRSREPAKPVVRRSKKTLVEEPLNPPEAPSSQQSETAAGMPAVLPVDMAGLDPDDRQYPGMVLLRMNSAMLEAGIDEAELMQFLRDVDVAGEKQTAMSQLATKKILDNVAARWPNVVESIMKGRK